MINETQGYLGYRKQATPSLVLQSVATCSHYSTHFGSGTVQYLNPSRVTASQKL